MSEPSVLLRKDVIELVFDADRCYTWICNHSRPEDKTALLNELKAVLDQPWAVVVRSATQG